jgi:hypothetical protein
MHTSAGAACGRDDDADAPELSMCRSSRNSKVKESARHVNRRILAGLAEPPVKASLMKLRGLALNLILHKDVV